MSKHNNISHSFLIDLIRNDIIPEMQSSRDPEGAIIKIASRLQLPTDAVSHIGKLINTLKVNSVFDNASESSTRGENTALLDVGSITDKYAKTCLSSHTNKSASKNIGMFLTAMGVDDDEEDESIIIKTASAHYSPVNIIDIQDLFIVDTFSDVDAVLDSIRITDDSQQIKQASAEDNYRKLCKEIATEENNLQTYYDTHVLLSENLKQTENEIAELFKYANFTTNKFHEIEQDLCNAYDGNDIDALHTSLDTLHHNLCNNHAAMNTTDQLLRANDIYDNNKFGHSKYDMTTSDATLSLFDTYHTTASQLRLLNDYITDSIAMLDKFAAGQNVFNNTPIDFSIGSSKPKDNTPKGNNAHINFGVGPSNPPGNIPLGNNTYAYSPPPTYNTTTPVVTDVPYNVNETFSVTNTTQPQVSHSIDVNGALNSLGQSINTGVQTFEHTNSNILKAITNMSTKTVNKQEKIQNAINGVFTSAIFNDLIYTDDVLSKLDEKQVDTLTEVYESALKLYPSIKTNKALARSFLRAAVQTEGIDVGTAEVLSKINKKYIHE